MLTNEGESHRLSRVEEKIEKQYRINFFPISIPSRIDAAENSLLYKNDNFIVVIRRERTIDIHK